MCAYKSKVFSTSDGGTGLSVAGANTNVLTSNGSAWTSAAPSGGAGLGYTLQMQVETLAALNDNTTYFFRYGSTLATNTSSLTNMVIPKTGTITAAFGSFIISGLASSENSTVAIRLNNTTDTSISTTVKMNANPATFSNAALSIAVTAGDYIEIKLTTPAWATNPTTVGANVTIYIS